MIFGILGNRLPLATSILLLTTIGFASPMTAGRQRESFDFDWKFHRGEIAHGEDPALSARDWQSISLPHDWAIAGPLDEKAPAWGSGGWLPGGVGWYRKEFQFTRNDAGKTIWIEFDGIYHNSDVWINGKHLGHRAYGYSSCHYDLTPHLKFDAPNVIAVRVDNSDQPNCRWYSGSGIYRHAWLTKVSSAAHVAHWGTYITTPAVASSRATIRIRTSIEKQNDAAELELETTILDPAGNSLASSRTKIRDAHEIDQEFEMKSPALWTPEQPSLYVARSTILQSGNPIDDSVTTFGIREVRFDKDRGFLLNGHATKLKGVCLHHDGGCVGAAVPDRVLERRLEILKEIGCNAIRCAHNPPAPELLDLCDKMGFLVIDEAFDKWAGDFSKPKEWWMRQKGFDENWQQDLRAMLHRDRNHPCIILWSVGNETGQAGTAEVDPTLKKLVDFVHREEPSRAVTAALCNSNAHTLDERVARIVESSKLMDVLCLNYQEPLYERIRAGNPNTVIIGSETFKYFRGGEMNVHSFEPVNPWFDVLKHDYVAGGFIWPGIDYLGESTRFPVRGSPAGIIDTCGFLKPEGWYQRSMWRDEPVVRIAVLTGEHQIATSWDAPAMVEHWNFPKREGQLLTLQTQTNCNTVELILNGKSNGRRSAKDYPNRAIAWFVPYHPGTIEALARNDGEQIVARHELKTAGPVARIVLHSDCDTIRADGQGVAHVVAELVDEHGTRVPDCDTAMQFSVEGPASIIGVDNGDLTDPKLFATSSRETRQGRCLAIVQSQRNSGKTRLIARTDAHKCEVIIRSIDVQSEKSN